jgi:hypothetical protein
MKHNSVFNLATVFECFVESIRWNIDAVGIESFYCGQRMNKRTNSIECHVWRQRRLIERPDGARSWIALPRFHLVDQYLQQFNTGFGISSANKSGMDSSNILDIPYNNSAGELIYSLLLILLLSVIEAKRNQ